MGSASTESSEVFDAENHWGLASMHERAEQIGAEFRLTSARAPAPRLRLSLPVS